MLYYAMVSSVEQANSKKAQDGEFRHSGRYPINHHRANIASVLMGCVQEEVVFTVLLLYP